MEGGLRISPEQWSALLYGDQKHKSDMQSIIDKVCSGPADVTNGMCSGVKEVTIGYGLLWVQLM